MRKSHIASLAGVALLASACMTVAPPPGPPPPAPAPGACRAEPAMWAIGERASPGVLERATLDSGARSARVLQPGEVVTMEFNGDRLTVEVDGAGRITNVRCG